MLRPQRDTTRNRLSSVLPDEAFVRLQFDPCLIDSASIRVLISINTDIINIYFREYEFVSAIAASDIFGIEIGLIGGSPMAGAACRIGVDTLRPVVAENASPRPRFVHTALLQARRTAFVDATALAEIRLTHRLRMRPVRVDGGSDGTAETECARPVEGS